jgi:hypothetical protein
LQEQVLELFQREDSGSATFALIALLLRILPRPLVFSSDDNARNGNSADKHKYDWIHHFGTTYKNKVCTGAINTKKTQGDHANSRSGK